jgi:hypothetical protein
LRNRARQLSKLGTVEHRLLTDGEELPRWTADFLELEARGWKGKAGSALASTPGGAAFFSDVVRHAFERNRLMMMGLFIDERPAALFSGFLAAGGVVSFKTAMDESLARCSPGVLLMTDVIRQVHQLPPAFRWLDSCSSSDSTLKQLLGERLPVHSLLLAARPGGLAEALVAGAPLLRWGWRRLRPVKDAAD